MKRIEINKDNSRIVYDVIPKQKIRDKIKELEDKKEQYNEQPLIYHILKSQLESLLKEN